jgi:hypothetical protein
MRDALTGSSFFGVLLGGRLKESFRWNHGVSYYSP